MGKFGQLERLRENGINWKVCGQMWAIREINNFVNFLRTS